MGWAQSSNQTEVNIASITKRQAANGADRFQVAVRIRGAGERWATLPTLEAAEEFGKRMTRALKKEAEEARDPRASLPPSGSMLDERLLNTITRYQRACPKGSWHQSTLPGLLRIVGDPLIGDLHPSWIKRYIQRARKTMTIREKGYAWGSISHQLCLVSKILQWRADELNVNPPPFVVRKNYKEEAAAAEGLRKEALNNERDRRLEPGEEEALMAHLASPACPREQKDHWPLLVRFAIATGARLQEMILADWKEFHSSGESWNIPWQHSKTKDRTMMLTDEAMDALEELRRLRDPSSSRIFHTFVSPKAASSAFSKIRTKVGLENFVFHDLRHEGISRFVLTQIGLPIKAVMEMVGHSDIKMLNRYAKMRAHELGPLMRRRERPLPEAPIRRVDIGGAAPPAPSLARPRLKLV